MPGTFESPGMVRSRRRLLLCSCVAFVLQAISPPCAVVPKDLLWQQFRSSPLSWQDLRGKKEAGSVNPKSPDFKRGADALWIVDSSTPKWVRDELPTLLPFSQQVSPQQPAPRQQGNYVAKAGTSPPTDKLWKDLFETPARWKDYRLSKTHPRAPDFKRADGEASLWIDSRKPDWVAEKLATSPAAWDQGGFKGPHTTVEFGTKESDTLWQRLFEDPSDWVDNRNRKADGEVSPRFPDFSSSAGDGLWLDSRTSIWASKVKEVDVKGTSQWNVKPLVEDLWRDFFQNKDSWKSYIVDKSNGSRKSTHPDFKRDRDTSLWIDDRSTPDWVRTELQKQGI